MVQRRGPRLTAAQKTEVWRRWRHGESLNAIGRALGRIPKMVRYEVARTGGIPSHNAPSAWFVRHVDSAEKEPLLVVPSPSRFPK